MANPTVTIEIKEVGSAEVIRRLRKVRQEAGKLTGAKKRLSDRVKKTGETFKKSGKDVSRFSGLMQNLETNAVLALGPLSGVGARIRAIGVLARRGNIGLIAFSIGVAAIVAVIGLLTAGLIKTRLALEPIEGRLRAVTGSALIARLELERLSKMALGLGLDFKSLAEGFSRLSAAARGTSLEGEGIRKVFDAIAKTAGALRLSAEDTEGIIRALEQALTKGVLRAEEFNQQLGDRLPGAAVLASRAINKTKQAFQALLVAGEIITEEFLPKLAEEFEKIFSAEAERNAETLRGSLNRLGTSITILFDIIEARLGVADRFAQFINKAADAIVRFGEFLDTPLAKTERRLKAFEESILAFELEGVLESQKKQITEEFVGLQRELIKQISNMEALAKADPEFVKDIREFLGGSNAPRGLGVLEDAVLALGKAINKLNQFAIRPLAEITPPDITKITKAFDKIVRSATTASKETQQIMAGNLFGAEFEGSLLKAQNRLAKFSKNVVVAFADANKLISKSLSDAFKEGSEADKARAFAEILGIVSDKFAIVIQNAKDFKSLGKVFEETRTPLEKYNIELARLESLSKRIPGNNELIAGSMNVARRAFINADEGAQLLSDGMDNLASGIVKAMTTAGDAMETFRELAKDVVDSVLESFVELSLVNPLKNLVFNLEEGAPGAFKTLGNLGGGFLGQLFGESEKAAESLKGLSSSSVESSGALSQQLVQAAIQAAVSTGVQSTAVGASTSAITLMAIAAEAAATALSAVAAAAGTSGGGGIFGLLGGLLSGGGGRAATAGTSIPGGIGGFSHGGSFIVPGAGGPDSRLVKFRVTPGEEVTVRTPSQQSGGTTVYIDAKGADKAAIARLERSFLALNATFKRRALDAVSDSRRRGFGG